MSPVSISHAFVVKRLRCCSCGPPEVNPSLSLTPLTLCVGAASSGVPFYYRVAVSFAVSEKNSSLSTVAPQRKSMTIESESCDVSVKTKNYREREMKGVWGVFPNLCV